MTTEILLMYVVYERPIDFPNSYVVRRFDCTSHPFPTPYDEGLPIIIGGDLEMIRRQMRQRGLVCITRNEEDHPTIVESWL